MKRKKVVWLIEMLRANDPAFCAEEYQEGITDTSTISEMKSETISEPSTIERATPVTDSSLDSVEPEDGLYL